MNDLIVIGNKVSIHFSTHVPIIGSVTYSPYATGDAWHITPEFTGGRLYRPSGGMTGCASKRNYGVR